MNKLLGLFILIFILDIGTVSERDVLPQSPWAVEGHMMRNEPKSSLTTVRTLSILVIYDNNPYREGLSTAWGFSCLLRGTEKTVLFDTGGDGSILLANMKELGIDPREIDVVVLSHIHGDHVGGLGRFLEKNNKVKIYLPVSFPEGLKKI